jgi:PIN domain nuclease of toxin-antitoxin system
MKKPTRSGAAAKKAHLLDTSTLLWALGEPERLSSEAQRLIESGDNIVSVASYWEVVIKSQKRLLAIADLPSWWQRATELMAARVLPIRASHVTALATLPTIHRDPFDRILIAQALAEGLGFVTNDEPIRQYPINTLW